MAPHKILQCPPLFLGWKEQKNCVPAEEIYQMNTYIDHIILSIHSKRMN